MTENPAYQYPHLDSQREELNKLKFMWACCCFSPLFYLAVALMIQRISFSGGANAGYWPLPSANYRIALLGCVVFAATLQLLAITIRTKSTAWLTAAPDLLQAVSIYTKRTFSMMMISELTVVAGFVLFLLNGDLRTVFGFGIVSMLLYGQSYPSENELGKATKLL